jgi:hypothetical protein
MGVEAVIERVFCNILSRLGGKALEEGGRHRKGGKGLATSEL